MKFYLVIKIIVYALNMKNLFSHLHDPFIKIPQSVVKKKIGKEQVKLSTQMDLKICIKNRLLSQTTI